MVDEIPINVLMQYFRVPTGNVVVDYPGRTILFGSCITNISTTGVFIRTDAPLPRDSAVNIAFYLPGEKTQIHAQTVVRWSFTGSGTVPFDPALPVGMGLEFTRMPPAHRQIVAIFVEDFLARMRK